MKYEDIKVGVDYACDLGQRNIVQATVIEKGTFEKVGPGRLSYQKIHRSVKGAKVRTDRGEHWLESKTFLTEWSTHARDEARRQAMRAERAARYEAVKDRSRGLLNRLSATGVCQRATFHFDVVRVEFTLDQLEALIDRLEAP